ncbi:MAG TPA: hypothetical protein VFQ22_04890 [Longimicrobiales bacterium]|nr:hypothetical protein [Longimicrobiales bacterium]
MKIAIIGTGLEGLVTGACFADRGHHVTCCDDDGARIARLHAGQVPAAEPGLQSLVETGLERGALTFTTDLAAAVRSSHVIVLAVPVPVHVDGSQDTTRVLDMAGIIGRAANDTKVVALVCATPLGTYERARRCIERETDFAVHLAVVPTLLEEGDALRGFRNPERIVLGTHSGYAATLLRDLYASVVAAECPVLVTDPTSAEVARSAIGAMLAARATLMSSVVRLCERTGADPDAVLGAGPVFGSPPPRATPARPATPSLAGQLRVLQRIMAESGVDAPALEVLDDGAARVGDGAGHALPNALRLLRTYAMCARSTRFRGRRRAREQTFQGGLNHGQDHQP